MQTYRGVVKGNSIVLLEGVDLPDGQEVEVRVISSDVVPARDMREVGG